MNNKFVAAVTMDSNRKYSENGAEVYASTNGGALLDLFGVVGALRGREPHEIEGMFREAFKEDAALAMRLMFYARNVRGGLGERETFRIMLKWLCNNHSDLAVANLPQVVEFGRFDDLYTYVGTAAEEEMWQFMFSILNQDYERMMNHKPISLLAKWMKSINTSSIESRALARLTMQKLGFKTEKQYRKVLARMREYLKVTEHQMSLNQWYKIAYEAVPSYAMRNYRNAFAKHDHERWTEYLSSLQKGEAKVNATTLYPYDLVEAIENGKFSWDPKFHYDALIEKQWKALPNYVEDGANVLVMADVSGSMSGRPMSTSIGLANYFAQRNHGAFAGLYMTFTSEPRFITVRSDESLQSMCQKAFQDVGYSTNLDRAFEQILRTAIRVDASNEDMPRALVVISDMEIDHYCRRPSELDFVDKWHNRFMEAGYDMPQLVLWNVEARQNTYISSARPGIKFLSGSSASVFRDLVNTLNCANAFEAMLKTLMNPIYDCVVTSLEK